MKRAVLTMDLEDWYHLDYFRPEDCDKNHSLLDGLDVYRDLLNTHRISSTFFVIGELVHHYGSILRELAMEGHDIGCHGWGHIRPLTMSVTAFKGDLERSKGEIEEAIGDPLFGYRAPCFSLDRERLDIVQGVGFSYDSSRIDFADHPLYGTLDMRGFEKVSKHTFRRDSFFEFEVSTFKVGRKSIPVSGGGYLRIFPWFLMRWLIRRYLSSNTLYVLYIHPFELSIRSIPPLPTGTGAVTKLRFRTGRSGVVAKLSKLIGLLRDSGFEFSTFRDIRQNCLNTQSNQMNTRV